MKNKLQDLNNHLFAQLERLDNEELTAEELDTEIQRSKAITAISNQIIDNAKLALDATRLQVEFGIYTGYQHFIRIPIRSRTLIEDCAQKICRVRMHGE